MAKAKKQPKNNSTTGNNYNKSGNELEDDSQNNANIQHHLPKTEEINDPDLTEKNDQTYTRAKGMDA